MRNSPAADRRRAAPRGARHDNRRIAVLGALIFLALRAGELRAQSVSEAVINLFASAKMYVNPFSPAKKQADAWRRTRPADAALIDKIANQPIAQWMGNWNSNIGGDVRDAVSRITGAKALPLFVAYNIPNRDCGSYSGGGARSADAYRQWIRSFANGLGGKRSVVILEPDALAGMNCLSAPLRAERLALIKDAVSVLRSKGASVYIDAGHARWIPAGEMANRLKAAGIDQAAGFSLNISNFLGNAVNIAYGEAVSRQIGGKHFIIDTSRNGAGASQAGNWCNPSGQSIGAAPTSNTGNKLVDAFVWVKVPGESDGTCGGGPRAGQWWADYALALAGKKTVGILGGR
jgi:endoglucanase